ncbi:MAG: carbonic anhydrase [Spirochaetaceae bacterium]|nr:carbonic anhydrase [Spirochaetaceae bacterium]MDT8299676.1 carbonic anhydrase [Spirochaetaceae bacterium]
MEELFNGVKEFNSEDYREYRELFRELSRKQTPHTLFIGCSDSRVVPSLITKSMPGDLFVVRNVANVVPYYRQSAEYLATTSAIEYALNALNVENIVVCGHSNCGGCQAMWQDESQMAALPHTRRWLELSGNVKDTVSRRLSVDDDDIKREWMTEQLNVVEQMNHLVTYPGVKERYRRGDLNIYGWYYIIGTGEVFNYAKERRAFERIS